MITIAHAEIAAAATFAAGLGLASFAAFFLARRRSQGSPGPRGKQAVPLAPVVRLDLAREEPERRQRTERAS